MRRITQLLIALIALVGSPLLVTAQDASPAATECVAPDLPPGTPTPMEDLMPEATPAHDMEGMEMASPAAEAPPGETLDIPQGPLSGDPADEDTTARVTGAVENIIACLSAGDGLAFAALVTPAYLQASFGITNPYDMVYVMEGFPGVSLIAVENVLMHSDGRFSAEVTQKFGEAQVDRFQAMFVDKDGQLLLDEEITLPIEDADVTIEVSMVDFAFEMSENTIQADSTVAFNVTNDGEYPHEFFVIRLPEGVTIEQVLDAPEPPEGVELFGGVYADPGQTGSFALEGLAPGTYTVVCFIDVPDGIPHVMRGMVAALIVE
jgi:plastocyanin